MKIDVLDGAKADLRAGFDFYEDQESGAGNYFARCLASDIDSLAQLAGSHALKNGFHRMISARFPYAVYYLVFGDLVKVYAVIDSRQDPKRILHRLKKL